MTVDNSCKFFDLQNNVVSSANKTEKRTRETEAISFMYNRNNKAHLRCVRNVLGGFLLHQNEAALYLDVCQQKADNTSKSYLMVLGTCILDQ